MPMWIETPWEKLVKKVGLEAAKAEMSRRRKAGNHPGGSFKDKKFAKAQSAKAALVRKEKNEKEIQESPQASQKN